MKDTATLSESEQTWTKPTTIQAFEMVVERGLEKERHELPEVETRGK
jgi:hypothetical protein